MDILSLKVRILLQQATGVQTKNLVGILLTICSLLLRQASFDTRKNGNLTHLTACPILLNRVLSD